MRIGFAVFISLFLAADLLCWAVAARSLRAQRALRVTRWLCHAFFAFQVIYIVAMIGGFLLGSTMRRGPEWLPTPLLALAFVWHIVGLPAVCVGIMITGTIRRLVQAARWIGRRLSPAPAPAPAPSPAPSPASEAPAGDGMTRRGFLAGSVAIVPPLLAAGATGYALATNGDFRIQRLRMALPGLPPGMEGFRIAQVSDLHVGHWATDEFLHDVIQATNALNADVVLFTGDLIDLSIVDLPRAIEAAKQWRARHGVFIVEGNHDLIDDPIRFRNQIYASGMPFLRNSSFTIDHNGTDLQLLGIPWTRSTEQMAEDVQSIAARRDRGAYPILLAHHPHAFDAAAAAGLPLTLSGHTHGGQLALMPGLSAGNLMFKYVSGLYQKPGSQLLVSNGTGNWFPLRINVPAEIIEITLARA